MINVAKTKALISCALLFSHVCKKQIFLMTQLYLYLFNNLFTYLLIYNLIYYLFQIFLGLHLSNMSFLRSTHTSTRAVSEIRGQVMYM